MALIQCPECGGKISDLAKVCIHCGYPIADILIENREKEMVHNTEYEQTLQVSNSDQKAREKFKPKENSSSQKTEEKQKDTSPIVPQNRENHERLNLKCVIGNSKDWSLETYTPYSYDLKENEASITGCMIPESKRGVLLTIPNVVDGWYIVGIATDAFCNNGYSSYDGFREVYDNTSLHWVEVSDGIKYIKDSAFEQCILLKGITLPLTLEYIGDSCFQNCMSIREIKLPDNLKEIGAFAFEGCSKLESINFPPQLEEIGGQAFQRCGLYTIDLNEGIKTIGAGAFCGCDNLRAAYLPRSLSKIWGKAFDRITKYSYMELEHAHNNNITLYCYPDTYALQYAKENGYHVVIRT